MNTTLTGLAALLAAGIAAEERTRHGRLEHAVKLIEAEAKAELGTLQPGAAPFGDWPPLADSTQRGRDPKTPGIDSGQMRDSISHAVDAHAGEAVVGSNDPNLIYFEMGTAKQPPRSVLGLAAVRKEKQVVEILGRGTVRTLFSPDGEQEL